MSISASETRKTLFPLIERVNEDRVALEIVSRKGNVILTPADEYAAWQETACLFRSTAHARGLLDAYERAAAGQIEAHELDREDWVRLVGDASAEEVFRHRRTTGRRTLTRINTLIDACFIPAGDGGPLGPKALHAAVEEEGVRAELSWLLRPIVAAGIPRGGEERRMRAPGLHAAPEPVKRLRILLKHPSLTAL